MWILPGIPSLETNEYIYIYLHFPYALMACTGIAACLPDTFTWQLMTLLKTCIGCFKLLRSSGKRCLQTKVTEERMRWKELGEEES
jgi:hypothetical protein